MNDALNEAAPTSEHDSEHVSAAPSAHLSDDALPLLHPAPGRCIVRIIPRLLHGRTATGLYAEMDGRYENQPMIGVLLELGDPTNSHEEKVCAWAKTRSEAGDLFIFSQYGSGSPYWNESMGKMIALGYDFRWLRGLRLFDIGNLGATVQNAGAFGQSAVVGAPDPESDVPESRKLPLPILLTTPSIKRELRELSELE
jgi:hypothetical protein